ncbi:MAG: hypothetical protein ACYDCQ_04900 [Dehalococcoidia bacterium]
MDKDLLLHDDDVPSGTARYRWRRLRVTWAPLALVFLNGLALLFLVALTILLIPVFLLVLCLIWLLRVLVSLIPEHSWLRRRQRLPAGDGERAAAPPGTLSEAQRYELAQRYRPCLMLFPEDPEFGPPYRTGERAHAVGADYHPRDVRVFLRYARLRRGRTQWLPELPEITSITEIRDSLGKSGERESSLETPWLHGGNPLKIFRHLMPVGRQFHTHRAIPLPTGDCGCSTAAWQRYLDLLALDEARPAERRQFSHTFYARVLEGAELPEVGADHPLRDAVVVQYWFFSFYNDAWNRHQGDWEGITVFLHPAGAGYAPLGAAYASHDLGRWRRWQDIDRVDDDGVLAPDGTHPQVFVARGSHASYFDYNENGYHPAMARKLRVPLLGEFTFPAQFVLESRNATDWVATDARSGGNGVRVFTENIKLMPPEALLRDLPGLRQNDEWWWLAYRGLWGAQEFLPFFGGSGPRGPQWQGVKWDNPFLWVMRHCIADEMPYWVEMFSAWQPEEPFWEDVAMPDEPVQREVPA